MNRNPVFVAASHQTRRDNMKWIFLPNSAIHKLCKMNKVLSATPSNKMTSATYNQEKVYTKLLCTYMIIYYVVCYGGPVCISKVIHRASNKITDFRTDMFNTSIQPLIYSSYVARTASTPKQVNKRIFMMRGKNIFSNSYLSLPPTRHDLTQGQKPEGRLKEHLFR